MRKTYNRDPSTYRTKERYEARCPASYCGSTVFENLPIQTKASGLMKFTCWRCGMVFLASVSHLFRVDENGQRVGIGPPKEGKR